ncbi:hypothetical protein GA0070603_2892 [Micromonospora chersina]|uniref:Uncharacterized protein n=1 Tax=Micromonospora chersina TaxID=47854 RepID=A0A1C6V0I7_9ACTN|nr:hypothetical protein GA0070603_2892 [Micromonospora chersina]
MSTVFADFPLLAPVIDEALALTSRAIRVNVPWPWPRALLCRTERRPYPCRRACWGHAALESAGPMADQLGGPA